MAIYQCEFRLTDKNGDVPSKELFYGKLQAVLAQSRSWCLENLIYGSLDKTCVEVFYFDNKVDEITVKIDISTITKKQIDAIIDFINDNELCIKDGNKLIVANYLSIIDLIKNSAAMKFLNSPIEFLEECSKKCTGDGE